ncbi:MAG TPA: bifunctional alpha/beta hydrolase/OsmC family protein [Wenzhouxiangellaceae bacterium]|nr:bifunctional alpha/beta hydrolase/OsmC family protein [Wenzhouxiangellaceae bacterium]
MTKIRFTNRQGITLTGNLELPPGGAWQATALFAHCFTCTRNIKAARNISRALADAGFAVLRFDFTGLGESEGDFSDTDFSSNLDDLEDAAAWVADELDSPQLLVGHSLGGAAALAVAERLQSVRAVATLAAPSSADHILTQFGEDLDQIEAEGSAEVKLAGRPFRIRRDFVEDARSHSIEERLKKLRRALLILHSPVDKTVGIENAQKIFAAALHPKSFVSLDNADHLLSNNADSRYAGQVISAWASRFLELDRREPVESVKVFGRTADKFLCRVQAGRHELLADEPERHGGEDQGPDPYRYLASALGTCTVMTLNMYARQKKLDIELVTCEVIHDRVHADDCTDCEDSKRKIDRLQRVIAIEGNLDDDQRARMLEIADRCPVHRTLENGILVESRME